LGALSVYDADQHQVDAAPRWSHCNILNAVQMWDILLLCCAARHVAAQQSMMRFHASHPAGSQQLGKLSQSSPSAHTWAAQYNTWLLFKLTPTGVVFSFLSFFFSHVPTIAPLC